MPLLILGSWSSSWSCKLMAEKLSADSVLGEQSMVASPNNICVNPSRIKQVLEEHAAQKARPIVSRASRPACVHDTLLLTARLSP